MFDWNDEELLNIIWDEHGESQDHIVPYPDAKEARPRGYRDSSKKEPNKESITRKSTESKETITVAEKHGLQQEGSPEHDKRKGFPATELNMDSWPDQESLGSDMPDNTSKIPRHDADNGSDEKEALLDNKTECFESRLEDCEQGDFVDYSWASVGSFEDLDRIFSNDEDAVFGHRSLGNPIEPWSPSRDVVTMTEKSVPSSGDCPRLDFDALKRSAEQFEGQGKYLSGQTQSFTPGYKNLNLLASDIPLDIVSCPESINSPGSSGNLLLKEKTALKIHGNNPSYRIDLNTREVAGTNEVNEQHMDKDYSQKRLVKSRKKLEVKSETSHLQNFQVWTQSGNPFLEIDSAYAPNVGSPRSSFLLGQLGQLQGAEPAQYNHFHKASMLAFTHGNIMKHYPKAIMSHPGECSQQSVLSCYEVPYGNMNPIDQSTKVRMKSSMMTPQEKIEKLRKRQQMRARLAIQKQQQKFGNQVSSTEYSCRGGEHNEAEENLSTFSSVDPSSPEQDNSSTACMAPDDCLVQDSILYHLQDIVGKLDLRVRLCMRDSLYRLAQGASQRQYSGYTNSSNKSNRCDFAGKDEINSQNRVLETSEAETETNPIDRTVAYLLFHKRLEPLGKHFELPDSPLTANLKASSSMRSEQPQLNANQDQLNSGDKVEDAL